MSSQNKSRKIALLLATVAPVFAGVPVMAQETAPAAQPSGAAREPIPEIVVTATRRSTDLQDTALSVSALSGDQLEARGLRSVADAVALIPGVSPLTNQPGGNEITIRGVNTATTSFSQTDVLVNATTAVYLDQLPVTSTIAKTPDFRFVDMERIEVIRRPQGTLYGQSAMGGLVRYITNRPDTSEFSGRIGSYASNTDEGGWNVGLEGHLNVPITDNLAARFVAYGYENDGYIDIVGTRQEEDANAEHTIGGRAALRWRPTDRVTADLNFLYHRVDLDSLQFISSTYTPTGNPLLNGFPVDLRPASTSRLEAQHVQPTLDETFIVSADVLAEFKYFDVNLIVGRKDTETENLFEAAELTGSSESFGRNSNIGEATSTTAELRFVSANEDSRINWLFGVWYEDADGELRAFAQMEGAPLTVIPMVLVLSPGDIAIDSGRQLVYEELAFYGEVGLRITDQLKATLGYRRSTVENNYEWTFARGSLDPLLGRTGLIGLPQVSEEDVNTYRVNVEYAPTDTLLFFAQASSGYRPGGFNPGTAFAFPPIADFSYESDSLWNYEAGVRSSWLDGRFILNAVAYHIDWSDIQLNSTQLAFPFYSSTVNAGKAKIDGLELEATLRPTDQWTFSAAYAWTDARIDEPASMIPGFSQPPGMAGDPLPGVADNAFSFLADWRNQLNQGAEIFANATFRYVAERPAVLGRDDLELPSASLLDTRAGVSFESGLTMTLFVDNVTNEITINQLTPGGFLSGQPFRWYAINRPRTIGLQLSYDF
ncbi:MAG: TonB-dependent receptor [Alphaproteobacteria bacterium]|nr:TonB-dependent receptor [Alphaproteobacteria bacterium]